MRKTFKESVEEDKVYLDAFNAKNNIQDKTYKILNKFCEIVNSTAGKGLLSCSKCWGNVSGEQGAQTVSFTVMNHGDRKNSAEPLHNYQIKDCTAGYKISFSVSSSGVLRQIIFGEEKFTPTIAVNKDYVYIDPTGGSHRAISEGFHRTIQADKNLLDDPILGRLLSDIYDNLPNDVKARIDWNGVIAQMEKAAKPETDKPQPRTNTMGAQLV